MLDCSAPVLLVHDSFKTNPRRKSTGAAILSRIGMISGWLSLSSERRHLPSGRLQCNQCQYLCLSGPIHLSASTTIVQRRRYAMIFRSVGLGLPVAQHVFFRMNQVDVAVARGCKFQQSTHDSFRHCNGTQSCRDGAVWKQGTQGYHDGGSCIAAGTESFYVKLGRGIKPCCVCAIPNARQKWQAHEDSRRLKREEFPP